MPSVKSGIDGIPTITIPNDPAAFVNWFKTNFLPRWASNADVRNAVAGAGITISGDIASVATIASSPDVQALFAQPYVLVGAPVSPAPLTGYRAIAAQASVLTLTDGGAEGSITVGVAVNGIGNTQLRQGAATSVIGNSTGSIANVADIAATANGQVLQMAAGALTFASLSAGSLAAIANNTVLGNNSGGSAPPVALTQTQLTALINLATTGASGAMPQLDGNAAHFLNGNGVLTTPAYATGANPSASVGLTAVNGSATTFLRSDGAPALSQAITPVWTGLHNFTPSSGAAVNINSATALIQFYNAAGSTRTGYIDGIAGAGGGGGATEMAIELDASTTSDWLSFVTGGSRRVRIQGTGNMVINAPTSGDALSITNVAGANALTLSGNAAGTAVIRLLTQAATGTATPTFANNKPGASSTTAKWIPINLDNTTYYVPAWT